MCELLGISFNTPVSPRFSFRGIQRRSSEGHNPDGWGVAYYPEDSKRHSYAAQVLKEPIAADKSRLLTILSDYPQAKSKLFIAHVRKRGPRGATASYRNTHPFQRELHGRDYVFAHNGTLNEYRGFETGRFKPLGETDSEYALCHILNLIEKTNTTTWQTRNFELLQQWLRDINRHGKFNCIFSDGENLFCYSDANGRGILHFVQRKAPYGRVQLLDEDYAVDLAEEKSPHRVGLVVATKPMTDETWKCLMYGSLVVFRDGCTIFGTLRSTRPG